MDDTLSKVWTLKYAPQKIEDMLLSEYNKKQFIPLTELKSNLLFLGNTGGGKTTLAKLLANKFSPNSYLFIKASEESGIDVVRNKISDFVSTTSFDGSPKIVILDECDGMSFSAQQALRGVMEEYLDDVKFIITGNYKHKLIEAIQSRGAAYEFTLEIKQILIRMMQILGTERIELSDEDKKGVVALVKKYYPDVRKTINELQRCCLSGKFEMVASQEETISPTIIDMLNKKQNVWDIRKYVIANEVYFNNDYHFLMRNLFDLYVKEHNAGKVLCVVDAMYKHAIVADPEVNFTGLLINLFKL